MYNAIESVASYRSDKQPPSACITDCCVHWPDLSNKMYKYTVEQRKYRNVQKTTLLNHLHGSVTIWKKWCGETLKTSDTIHPRH